MRSETFECFKELWAEHGDAWQNKQYAEVLGVNQGTTSRYRKQLLEADIYTRIKEELRAEILADIEAEKAEGDAQREAMQVLKEQDHEAHLRRQLKECGRVMVTTTKDRMIGWQGMFFYIHAGIPTEVPAIIAQQLEQIRESDRERDRTIGYFRRG